MQIVSSVNNLPPIWEEEGQEIFDVFIDDGYDQNKVGYWANVEGVKKFVAFKYPTSAQMGRVLSGVNGDTTGFYDIDGISYTVNEYVTNEATRNKGFAFSEIKGAIVHHGLKLAGFGGKKVALSTTLPIGYYYRDGAIDKPYIDKVKEGLQREYSSADGKPLANIVPEEHNIHAESICAFLAYVLGDENGEFKDIQGGFAVCDIGGNTTDISVLVPGQTISIAHELCGSREIGVLNIKDTLERKLQDKFDLSNLPSATLSNALSQKTFSFLNNQHDIKQEVTESQKITAKRLLGYISELVGDFPLSAIMFSGGGANVMGDALKLEYANAIKTTHPEFDNLLGLMLQKSL